MKDSSGALVRKGTKAALALAVSMTLFLNAAYASSAVTLESANPQHTGLFGNSVAISGTMAVVGAPFEDGDGYSQAGHAFIIDTTANALPITLTSPNAEGAGSFGQSVAISGTTVVVGAPGEHHQSGHAYTFDATTGTRIATLTSPNAQPDGDFGYSVAISGTTVVVGAPGEVAPGGGASGQAYSFDATTGTRIATLTDHNAVTGGNFGRSVAISGTTAVVGAPGETGGAGNAYVLDAASGSLISTLTSPNTAGGRAFGQSVAISGTTVVVGAPEEDVLVFPIAVFPYAGHAYVFDTSSGSPPSTLTSPNAQTNGAFGASVAISCDTTVVVGAPMETAGAGHAYVFDATTGAIATLTSPYAQEIGDFGRSVAINEGDPTVVVGAPMETASGQFVAGHAYLFLI